MKIMVTGGAGFIGSHIVNSYINAGHDVVIIDDLSSGEELEEDQEESLSSIIDSGSNISCSCWTLSSTP